MLIGLILFAGVVIGVLASYRLFMRGNTPRERVAGFLPAGFAPNASHRKGDTYVGYEDATRRLVLVDWPHGQILRPQDIQSLQPVQETMLGITHFWIAIGVSDPDPAFPRYRIWFQFRRGLRDAWLARLATICNTTSTAASQPATRASIAEARL